MSGECLLGCLWGVSVVFSGRSVGLSVHMKKAIIHRASSLCVPTSMMQFWTKPSTAMAQKGHHPGLSHLCLIFSIDLTHGDLVKHVEAKNAKFSQVLSADVKFSCQLLAS